MVGRDTSKRRANFECSTDRFQVPAADNGRPSGFPLGSVGTATLFCFKQAIWQSSAVDFRGYHRLVPQRAKSVGPIHELFPGQWYASMALIGVGPNVDILDLTLAL